MPAYRHGKGWRGKYELPRDPITGKRRTCRTGIFTTKREAEVAEARARADASNGIHVDPSRVTVAEYLKRWLRQLDPAKVAARTREVYESYVVHHIIPYLGTIKLQQLRPDQITDWHHQLRVAKRPVARRRAPLTLGPHTIQRCHKVFSVALNAAVREGLIFRNVVALQPAPSAATTVDRILTKDDLRLIVTSLHADYQITKPGMRAYHVLPLVMAALSTGLRAGEIAALRWKNVDLDRAVLRVEASSTYSRAEGRAEKGPKTQAGNRNVPLTAAMVAMLREQHRLLQTPPVRTTRTARVRSALYRQSKRGQPLGWRNGKREWEEAFDRLPNDGNPESYVFPTKPDIRSGTRMKVSPMIAKQWANTRHRLNLPDKPFHSFRHTYGSLLLHMGVPIPVVSRRMGHANPGITLKIYAHVIAGMDNENAFVEELGSVLDHAAVPNGSQSHNLLPLVVA